MIVMLNDGVDVSFVFGGEYVVVGFVVGDVLCGEVFFVEDVIVVVVW